MTTTTLQYDIAESSWQRIRGWMLQRRSRGILIPHCHQVHTFFMLESIDLLYLDEQGNVVHIEERVPPWRIAPNIRSAAHVLELPAGTVADTHIQMEDTLQIPSLN